MMKKILSFLIVLGALTFINIDLFASSYNGISLDTPISELNNKTLRQIFVDNNELGHYNWNYDFTYLYDNKTGNYSHVNDHLILQGTGQNLVRILYSNIDYSPNDNLFIFVNGESNYSTNANNGTRIVYRTITGGYLNAVSLNNSYYDIYSYGHQDAEQIEFSHIVNAQASDTYYKVYENILINLTNLGITVNKDIMYSYYNLFKALHNGIDLNIYYDDGYDDGYDTGNLQGYNDGYDDGLFDYHTGNYYGQYDYTLSEPYDQATQANISLLSVFSLIIGVVMSMLGFIINIEMFGISIASILGTLAIGVSIIWLLKLIRG